MTNSFASDGRRLHRMADLFKQEYPAEPEEAFLTTGRPVFNLSSCRMSAEHQRLGRKAGLGKTNGSTTHVVNYRFTENMIMENGMSWGQILLWASRTETGRSHRYSIAKASGGYVAWSGASRLLCESYITLVRITMRLLFVVRTTAGILTCTRLGGTWLILISTLKCSTIKRLIKKRLSSVLPPPQNPNL